MAELTLKGIAAAEGVAVGPAFRYTGLQLEIPTRPAEPTEVEWARVQEACRQAQEELEALQRKVAGQAGEENAAIFEAHALMLQDPALLDSIQASLEEGKIAEAAVMDAAQAFADLLAGMDTELFAARAADVLDVGRRVVRILLGKPDSSFDSLDRPAVIVAQDLTPSDTARLNLEYTLGFCTVAGGLTSHTSILARSLSIPAVVGAGPEILERIAEGDMLVIDGSEGLVVVHPSPATQARYHQARAERLARLDALRADAGRPARTADGERVEVGANIGDLESARNAVASGAEGVGLLRTEFLYLQDVAPPGEERQVNAYRAIFEAMEGRPVIVRTLDIGGDKPPTYLSFPPEPNPFLGWRAIRYCLENLPLFKTQLRAILRAAEGHRALIMFPMISALEELRRAKEVLEEVRAELEREGLPYNRQVPVGIMVETPAAAMLGEALAAECDFFSVGTNDLTQYALAVDRTNELVASLYHPLNPAVLRLIKHTIDSAHAQGKWVGMCGELAGMKSAIPILLGLGLDEFSMVPSAIPEAKWLLSRLTLPRAREIADQALKLPTASEVEALMAQVLAEMSAPDRT